VKIDIDDLPEAAQYGEYWVYVWVWVWVFVYERKS
jgi:hypothetical protein